MSSTTRATSRTSSNPTPSWRHWHERLGRDRGRLRPHQHPVADVAGQQRPPPRRAPPGHALPRRCRRQRRAQHPRGAPGRPGARDRPLAGDARAARAARPRRRAEHRDAGHGRPRARARRRQLRRRRLAVRRDAVPGHAAGHRRAGACRQARRPRARTAYGDPHRIEFLGFFVHAVQAVVPCFEGPPMDPLPLPFQLQDPERLRQELAGGRLRRGRGRDDRRARREFQLRRALLGLARRTATRSSATILGELGLPRSSRGGPRGRGRHDRRPAVLTAPVNIGIGAR